MTGYPNEKRKTPGRFFWRLCLQTLGAVGVFFWVVSLCQSTAPQANQWRQTIAHCFTETTDLTMMVALLSGDAHYSADDAVAVQASAPSYHWEQYEPMTIPVSGTVIIQDGQEQCLVVATDISEPILAAYDGTVTDIVTEAESGTTIVISHPNGFVTTYGGCTACYVGLQEPVKRGQTIGCTEGIVADAMNKLPYSAGQEYVTGNFYFTASYLGEPINPLELL